MPQQRGYLWAELDVTDEQTFTREYFPRAGQVLKQFGARVLAATQHPEVIEGGRTVQRVILIEFDSPERARAFYHSREYQEVIGLRLKSASAHLYILEGLAQQDG
jgi:uncharacterized protein (DUF1330 family)